MDDVKRRTVSTSSSSSPAEHSRRRLCDGLDELDGAVVDPLEAVISPKFYEVCVYLLVAVSGWQERDKILSG